MMTKRIFFLFLFLLAFKAMNAQKLVIRLQDTSENIETLNEIRKLYFSGNDLKIDFHSGADDTYALADIRKLYFTETVSVVENNPGTNYHLKVYPNPSDDYILVAGIPENILTIDIYRNDGQCVLKIGTESGNIKIDTRQLASGLYFINAGGFTSKFIKR